MCVCLCVYVYVCVEGGYERNTIVTPTWQFSGIVDHSLPSGNRRKQNIVVFVTFFKYA